VYGADTEAHFTRIDAVEIDQLFQSGLEELRLIVACRFQAAGRVQPCSRLAQCKESWRTADQRPGCTHLVENAARNISLGRELIRCSSPVEQRIGGDSLPERAQLCDPLLGWITGDDGGIDGADRDAGNPIRMESRLREGFVDSRLVGAKGAAALEEQSNALEWRTGSRAAPISHNVMHGIMSSLPVLSGSYEGSSSRAWANYPHVVRGY